ncbi:MAG TPA: hypothetical protein VJT80_13475 [Steroidobacteraceae bacterium]|nr:hypothetical protein [Steroidobacteraceae bacterium]
MVTKVRSPKRSKAQRHKLSKAEQLQQHLTTSAPLDQRDIWTKPDIMVRWNISDPTFWRYRRQGHIPAPDAKIGTRKAWRRETILAAESVA